MRRIACSALGNRIYLGTVNSAGTAFTGHAKQDVTNDVIKSILDYVGVGNEIVITDQGTQKKYSITVKEVM